MEEFLAKLNIANKNNYINKLELDNKKKQARIEKYVSNFKKEIMEHELEKKKYLQKIQELTENNQKLQNENNTYKYILGKFPKWIIHLFVGKKNIGGYLNE